MKKLTLFVLISSWLSVSLSAQEDLGKELNTLPSATFAKQKDFVFMQQVPTSSLWKLPLTRFVEKSTLALRPAAFPAPRSSVAYEQKLNQALSLNIGLGFSINTIEETLLEYAGLNVEPRWYLGMRRRIKKGESANNLSGNYLGVQLSVFQYQGFTDRLIIRGKLPTSLLASDPLPESTGAAALLNIGIQRRIIRRSYLDFSAGIGVSYHQNAELQLDPLYGAVPTDLNEEWRPAFQAEIAFGLLLGKGKAEEQARHADFGFYERQRLFKINLANLIRGGSNRFYSGSLTLACEQQLGNSPFSLQLDATGHYRGYYNQFAYFVDIFFELGFEPRYYYKLSKGTRAGKSKNSLSSSYITLRSSFRFDSEELDQERFSSSQFVFFTPAWGFQRRLFKRVYMGYQIGLGYGINVQKEFRESSNTVELRSDFKFGLAF